MTGYTRNRTKWIAAGICGIAALLVAGCGTSIPRGSVALGDGGAYSEPNPFEALVMADAGLGASDPLGHQVFVANTDTRFAMGRMVWQMAAAEDPSIRLDEVFGDAQYAPLIPDQRIVTADEMRARRLDRLQPDTRTVGVDVETVSGEPETIREQFQDQGGR